MTHSCTSHHLCTVVNSAIPFRAFPSGTHGPFANVPTSPSISLVPKGHQDKQTSIKDVSNIQTWSLVQNSDHNNIKQQHKCPELALWYISSRNKTQYMSNTIKHQNTDILWVNIRQYFPETQNIFYIWAKHSTGQNRGTPEDQRSGAPIWPLASGR